MALRLILPPQNLALSFFNSPNALLRRRSLLHCSSSASSSLSETLGLDFKYGPSLSKGSELPLEMFVVEDEEEEDGGGGGVIDKRRFARVFDVAALRVPAEDCYALESRLRGHLLNWPRVRNVARVPGDEMDDAFRKLLWDGKVEGEEALSRRMGEESEAAGLSPILYREKLVKTFNCRGFLNFRHLAKISRPKAKRKKEVRREGKGKNGFLAVEVAENEGDDEDLSGLLGEDYRMGNWRGSTRLLLLDERYANKGVDELPQAVKMVLHKGGEHKKKVVSSELVKCKLTLFYDYWPANEVLEYLLPENVITPTSFETVGHIAHLNLRDEHLPYKKLIAEIILDKNKPRIRTVVNKTDSIQNDYRTMQLEVLAGNHSLVTSVIESGICFHVDLATVYWNSRLSTERQRLLTSFSSSDVLCDVFSGVGPIAISAAKKVNYVYANDLNPTAVEYLERNLVHNKLERKVEVFNMDGRRFIETVFALRRPERITQVVMNLPKDAVQYLDVFRGIFKRRSQDMDLLLPKIHVYGFSKASDPEFDFHERIRTVLCDGAIKIDMHRVRLVAPGKWMLCASFVLPKSVAYAKDKELLLS
ncbi:tRNA (guanine(37)-N1)-methyltransferase 1 [Nymphaea colorata]|nr:tRNA (guanine(37)-N1)-methyltransferase 1 [Nymphaea colorata]